MRSGKTTKAFISVRRKLNPDKRGGNSGTKPEETTLASPLI